MGLAGHGVNDVSVLTAGVGTCAPSETAATVRPASSTRNDEREIVEPSRRWIVG